MIEIERTPNADSRSGGMKIEIDDLADSTIQHIYHVDQGMAFFEKMLRQAGEEHDHTKLYEMKEFHNAITTLSPGDEFKKGPWYQRHITKERHHLNSKVPDDVNLIDILEFVTDCVTAGMSRNGKIYEISLSNEVLQKAFANTVELFKKQIKLLD